MHELAKGVVFAGYTGGSNETERWVGGIDEVHWFDGFKVAGVFVEPAWWGEFVFLGLGVENHDGGETLVEGVFGGDYSGS